jgi:Rad/Gem-related GTP binding protein 1
MNVWREYDVDAFVIVYSITDRRSYQKAVDLMFEMRKVCEISTAVILVANKADLVRARTVTEEGGA